MKKTANYSNKSGTEREAYKGLHPKPPTKSGEAVEKANTVKSAPRALGR